MMAAKKKTSSDPAKKTSSDPTCTVPGCRNQVLVRGLCEKHWTAGRQ